MKIPAKIFVGVFLTIQVLLPLRFYLQDTVDERFAWRMFITKNEQHCDAQVTVTSGGRERHIDMLEILHPAWVLNIKDNKPDVIKPYLARVCAEPAVDSVVLVNNCTFPGRPLTTDVYSEDCPTD